jgi:hypothetical protein
MRTISRFTTARHLQLKGSTCCKNYEQRRIKVQLSKDSNQRRHLIKTQCPTNLKLFKISNDFYIGKTPKLAPTFTGPGEIIDINDTNAKVKINNKIKILNVNKLKLFLQNDAGEESQTFLDYNFNDNYSDKPLTRARAKLINYKNAVQLALLMLNEEGGSSDFGTIDSLCSEPCPSCDTENDYFKLNPPKRNFMQKCNSCEEFKKLFLKLKEHKEQCYQLKQQINFARQHRLHQINQIKSVDTKSKTGITESLREPLMKIAQQLLISDKNTFDQLTPTEQQHWTTFETTDIYRFLTGEEDTVPEFQYNWTSVPKLQPLGPSTTTTAPAPVSTAPPVAPPAPPLPPVSPPSSSSSTSPATSTPHSSPTPSTSGTRPKTSKPQPAQQPQPDPPGASTSGTTPQAQTKAHNLRQTKS